MIDQCSMVLLWQDMRNGLYSQMVFGESCSQSHWPFTSLLFSESQKCSSGDKDFFKKKKSIVIKGRIFNTMKKPPFQLPMQKIYFKVLFLYFIAFVLWDYLFWYVLPELVIFRKFLKIGSQCFFKTVSLLFIKQIYMPPPDSHIGNYCMSKEHLHILKSCITWLWVRSLVIFSCQI